MTGAFSDNEALALLLDRLERLYKEMDAAWKSVADAYGFVCRGCDTNCCESEFYHHTHIEQAFLRAGFQKLPAARRNQVRRRAKTVNAKRSAARKRKRPLRIMCPLNEEGRCILYAYRPMICRLHGVPHELRKPGKILETGPGCEPGSPWFDTSHHPRLDRTPFYRELAALEMAFRQHLNHPGNLKMTIGEMLL